MYIVFAGVKNPYTINCKKYKISDHFLEKKFKKYVISLTALLMQAIPFVESYPMFYTTVLISTFLTKLMQFIIINLYIMWKIVR